MSYDEADVIVINMMLYTVCICCILCRIKCNFKLSIHIRPCLVIIYFSFCVDMFLLFALDSVVACELEKWQDDGGGGDVRVFT